MAPRPAAVLLAAALAAGALVAAPTAVAADGPRVEQSASQPGQAVRPKSARRALLTPARTSSTVVAPRLVTEPVTEPVTELVETVEAVAPGEPAAPVEALPTGPHAFLNVDNGEVTRWNPCQPVPWQFNPAGAPEGGLEVVQAAMATLAQKTGLPLQYEGTAPTAPTAAYLAQSWGGFRPLLVGWTSATESDLLAGADSSMVGMARILWTGSYAADGSNRTQIASGVVALNTAHVAGTSGAASWYTFALHELGHAVGLGHVEDSEQIMRASIPRHLETYGSGDLEGLRAVGSGGGCLPSIR